ncbi:Alpha/Beta hydrolase protein [Morchella snyderi]|nr:Alpha/Beta hydrolase protein [Morchella snyderi]
MHGLFGSKQNNRTISKALARDLNRPVYAVDLRNHGDSPHHKRHDYIAMAEDVEHFLVDKKLGPETTLLGHSMGAKAAMAVSLRSPSLVRDLVIVDNAPVSSILHSSFGTYIRAMRQIEESQLKKQSEADKILSEYEPNLGIRQFLLTNLTREEGSPYLKFRVPIKILGSALDEIGDFPFTPEKNRFEGRALFVRGTKSHYVPDDHIPTIGRFFPLFRLNDIDAGHWVISEKPIEFKDGMLSLPVVEFLQNSE